MPREPTERATSRARVVLDGRIFMVDFVGDRPVRIKQRKTTGRGMKDVAYWSAKHHPPGGPGTIPSRVIAAAQEQRSRSAGREGGDRAVLADCAND